jgi:DUF971 family protein
MNPTEIRLNASRTQLSVTWENGTTSTYAAAQLRERARDAASVRMALNDWAVQASPDLTIANVDPVGNYGVRLAFSDGHDRGLFPWAYLAEIATYLAGDNDDAQARS